MKKILGATVIAVAALATTAAVAKDNTHYQQQAELAKLWAKADPAAKTLPSVGKDRSTRTPQEPRFRVLNVSPELGDWLSRTQARPAGR